MLGFVDEAVQRGPLSAAVFAQLPAVLAIRDELVGPAALGVWPGVSPRQRFEQPAAETNVGQPFLATGTHVQHQVGSWPRSCLVIADAGQQPGHGVADPVERGSEQHTVLVAVASPAPCDELVLHAVEVDSDTPAKHDVEVLERDRCHVRPVQPA